MTGWTDRAGCWIGCSQGAEVRQPRRGNQPLTVRIQIVIRRGFRSFGVLPVRSTSDAPTGNLEITMETEPAAADAMNELESFHRFLADQLSQGDPAKASSSESLLGCLKASSLGRGPSGRGQMR